MGRPVSAATDQATWHRLHAPSGVVPNGQYASISCASSTECVAVGHAMYGSTLNTQEETSTSFADVLTGKGWARSPVPEPSGSTSATLNGVWCGPRFTCVAVGSAYSDTVEPHPYSAVWNGSSWREVPVPNTATSGVRQFLAVSCVAGRLCVAVGDDSTTTLAANTDYPLMEMDDGSGWQVMDNSSAQQAMLDSVSCPTIDSCTAVGGTNDGTPYAEHWDGSSWSAEQVPGVADSYGGTLTGVSCTADGTCEAVGNYQGEDPTSDPSGWFADRRQAGTWAPDEAFPNGGNVASVTCRTDESCVAAGYQYGAGPAVALVATRSASGWVLATSTLKGIAATSIWCAAVTSCQLVGSETSNNENYPLGLPFSGVWNGHIVTGTSSPPDNTADGASRLLGVSCPRTSWCVAAGGHGSSEYVADHTLLERWNGQRWARVSSGLPVHGSFEAVSCPSKSMCMAVGGETSADTDVPIVARWNGRTWSTKRLSQQAGTIRLDGVSCADARDCSVVGQIQTKPKFDATQSLVERWNGKKWRIQKTPTLAPEAAGLTSVSCPTARYCLATGSVSQYFTGQSDQSGYDSSYVLAWNGIKWSNSHVPLPVDRRFDDLNGVSCRAVAKCVAVGDVGAESDTSDDYAIALTLSGSQWTSASLPGAEQSGGSSDTLNAVSCYRTGCTAVGFDGSTRSSSADPYIERQTSHGWRQVTTSPSAQLDARLQGVSCVGASKCQAVGTRLSYYDSLTLVETDEVKPS
jgi:hypothetical protein